MDIRSVGNTPSSLTVKPSESIDNENGISFTKMLQESMDTINTTAEDSLQQGLTLLTGDVDDLHSIMIATEKADIAFRLTLQVRNKVLDAYNEVMRMQI